MKRSRCRVMHTPAESRASARIESCVAGRPPEDGCMPASPMSPAAASSVRF